MQKPGINRNFDPCVPECGMLQLHSTLPQPVCPSVRLEWTASKGSFLNPHAPNPIYLAPSTRLPGGEDVWIVLKMTDGTGVQYTDHITVRVMKRW